MEIEATDYAGRTALHNAVKVGNVEVIRELIKGGIDVYARTGTIFELIAALVKETNSDRDNELKECFVFVKLESGDEALISELTKYINLVEPRISTIENTEFNDLINKLKTMIDDHYEGQKDVYDDIMEHRRKWKVTH